MAGNKFRFAYPFLTIGPDFLAWTKNFFQEQDLATTFMAAAALATAINHP